MIDKSVKTNNNHPSDILTHHNVLLSNWFVLFGLIGILVIAVFWLKKCRTKNMFNLYQNINKKEETEKESQVIGHERFYQERTSRSGSRKKRKVARRAHSAGEFSATTLTAANRRAAFCVRSHSSENRSDDGGRLLKTDTLARVFFPKRSSTLTSNKHEYSALGTDSGQELINTEERNAIYQMCKEYLQGNARYGLQSHLGAIGSRNDKHWFTVHDGKLGAERLLTLIPLPTTCPIKPSISTRDTMINLFRGLQHPYIHPILDIEFWDMGAILVSPLNPTGSLKDLIYGTLWMDPYGKKYGGRGDGLPLRTIQCLGRQILEGLLFLRNRYFPSFYHLHAGNVIIQNGVARLAGLENPLLGLLPKAPSAPETLAFGYLLFEMTIGYELNQPPTQAHLQLELERQPKVADALTIIFQTTRTPILEDLVCCDLFRGVELRELRGASIIQVRSPPDVIELLEIVRNPVASSPIRREDVVMIIETRQLEDIEEEDDNEVNSFLNNHNNNNELR